MRVFLYCFVILIALSCKKPESELVVADTVLDEYPDWYTLKAPVDERIVGVWGDYDKTVLISTMFKLFRTTDKGRTWEQVHQGSVGIMGVVQYQDTLFTMSGLVNQTRKEAYQQVIVQADNYSVDDGKTWNRYVARDRVLSDIPDFDAADKFLVNPIKAQGQTTYKINQVFLDGPTATTGMFETPGVIKSTGQRIDLPQLHQLQSLYLDDQQRLYIASTDAVCGSGMSFKFCNSLGGRGVVYVSKESLP